MEKKSVPLFNVGSDTTNYTFGYTDEEKRSVLTIFNEMSSEIMKDLRNDRPCVIAIKIIVILSFMSSDFFKKKKKNLFPHKHPLNFISVKFFQTLLYQPTAMSTTEFDTSIINYILFFLHIKFYDSSTLYLPKAITSSPFYDPQDKRYRLLMHPQTDPTKKYAYSNYNKDQLNNVSNELIHWFN